MDVPRNFHRPESESTSTDQTKTRNQCQKKVKNKYEYEYECINDNEYCCQNNQSLHNTVPSTPLEMDFVIVSVYDEGIQKLFGNISARDVAVCCTRNRELEKQKIISKQFKNRSSDCGMENENKLEEEEKQEQEQEVKNNGNMNMDGSTMDPPCPCLTSASASHSRCLSNVGKAEHDLKTCFCQNSEIKHLLDRLPSFNYSESCARTVDSLMRSSHKKEQYTFLLRLNQFVDENGIRVSGGRSALSLEGILPST